MPVRTNPSVRPHICIMRCGSIILKRAVDGQHAYSRRDVQPVIWDFVIDSLSDEEMMLAGLTAYFRNHMEAAERIWRTLAGGSPTHSGGAAFFLGGMLEKQGDIEGARAAYQVAIDSDHPNQAPMAAFNLGLVLEEQGDIEGARAAYQVVIDSGHPEAAPTAVDALRRMQS